MTNEKGYSMIMLIIAILAISAISFGAIKIYKDKIETSMPNIFENSNLTSEENIINDQIAKDELKKANDSSSQTQESKTEPTAKTEL